MGDKVTFPSASRMTGAESPLTEGPTASTGAKAAAPAERHRIEKAERDFATSVMSPGEEAMTGAARALRPHQSVEFACKASVGGDGGPVVKGEGKIRIERRDDGRYEVTVSANGAVGVSHHAAGVAAGSKFVVATPEAAADVAQAIATLGVTTAASATALGPLVNLVDRATGATGHAIDRLSHYAKDCVSLDADARILAHLKSGVGDLGKVEVEGLGAQTLRIDLEKGEVVRGRRLEVTGEAVSSMKLGQGAAASLAGQLGLSGDAELKVSITFEQRQRVPRELIEKFRRGEVSAGDLASALQRAPSTFAVVSKVEGEAAIGTAAAGVGRFEAKSELPIDAVALFADLSAGNLSGLVEKAMGGTWDAELELGRGSRPQVHTDLGGARLSSLVLTKHHLGGGRIFELAGRARQTAVEAERTDAFVEAQRARARLPAG